MKTGGIVKGAFILSVGGLLAKLFSAVYRIGLTRILGGVGIGVYQLIFPIYSLFVVLSTAGVPMAVSKIVAKHKGEEKVVIKKCVKYVLIFSFFLSVLLVAFSKVFANIQHVKELFLCYLILSPTIVLISVGSVIKGYFQGVKNFNPSAISNIIEQIVKLILGLILSLVLIRFSLIAAIFGAIVAICVSEFVSFVMLIVSFKKFSKFNTKKVDFNVCFKDILGDVLPITLTNIIFPISAFIDGFLVVNLLKMNFSTDISIYLYGLESGAVSSLINIPTIFSFAIATSIMPTMCCDTNCENKNDCFNLFFKLTLVISVPIVLILILFPNEILQVLYGQRISSYGYNGIEVCSRLMVMSAFGVFALTINQIFCSTLQANDERRTTILNSVIGVCVKFVFELIFIPFKTLNIYSLAIANSLCYILVAFLNFTKLKESVKFDLGFDFMGKLMTCCFVMVCSILIFLLLGNGLLNVVFAFAFGALVYLYLIFSVDILTRKEKAQFKYKV